MVCASAEFFGVFKSDVLCIPYRGISIDYMFFYRTQAAETFLPVDDDKISAWAQYSACLPEHLFFIVYLEKKIRNKHDVRGLIGKLCAVFLLKVSPNDMHILIP